MDSPCWKDTWVFVLCLFRLHGRLVTFLGNEFIIRFLSSSMISYLKWKGTVSIIHISGPLVLYCHVCSIYFLQVLTNIQSVLPQLSIYFVCEEGSTNSTVFVNENGSTSRTVFVNGRRFVHEGATNNSAGFVDSEENKPCRICTMRMRREQKMALDSDMRDQQT